MFVSYLFFLCNCYGSQQANCQLEYLVIKTCSWWRQVVLVSGGKIWLVLICKRWMHHFRDLLTSSNLVYECISSDDSFHVKLYWHNSWEYSYSYYSMIIVNRYAEWNLLKYICLYILLISWFRLQFINHSNYHLVTQCKEGIS